MYKINDTQTIAIKLLINFLKEHNEMGLLYGLAYYRNYEGLVSKIFSHSIGDKYIDLCYERKKVTHSNAIEQFYLIQSQLWRFYILDHIDAFPMDKQGEILETVRYSLTCNGTRGVKELDILFEKHKIIQ